MPRARRGARALPPRRCARALLLPLLGALVCAPFLASHFHSHSYSHPHSLSLSGVGGGVWVGLLFSLFELLRPACKGRWVYVYDLPPAFNTELLGTCPSARLIGQAKALGALGKSEDAEEGSETEPAELPLCRETQNRGLGPASDYGYTRGGPALGPGTGWYATGELALEQYFFERLLSHECRTRYPERAAAFYVPYLPATHLLWLPRAYQAWEGAQRERGAARRRLPPGVLSRLREAADGAALGILKKLAGTLRGSQAFRRRQGGDHFLVLGVPLGALSAAPRGVGLARSTQQFLEDPTFQRMRLIAPECPPAATSHQCCTGTNLSTPPMSTPMSTPLGTPMGTPPAAAPQSQRTVVAPYPSFFHASSANELLAHREWMLQRKQREILASLAAPAQPKRQRDRQQLGAVVASQCEKHARCAVLFCSGHEGPALGTNPGGLNRYDDCSSPGPVMDLYYSSKFCLQPPGQHAVTRRGVFDALLAGCVPVFFSPSSPGEQYWRHLPNASAWSILLNSSQVRRTGALRLLSGVRRAQLALMQQAIADLLPSFLYLHPSWRGAPVQGVKGRGGSTDWAQEGKLTSRPRDAFDVTLDALMHPAPWEEQRLVQGDAASAKK